MSNKCENGHALPPCPRCAEEAGRKRAETIDGIKMALKLCLVVPVIILFAAVIALVLIGW